MKALAAILCIALLLSLPVLGQPSDDCAPEAVGEWLIQRQVGRDLIQLYMEEGTVSPLETLLLPQEARRDLEDLPRPECADDLFMPLM